MSFLIDELHIAEAESALGVKFPSRFKEKMKRENGGEVEVGNDTYALYPFFDKTDIKRIKRTTNHIVLETKNAREWTNFPSNGIAIGDNGSGDKLVLLPDNNSSADLSDQIYIWSHEKGELNVVADDINELVE